MSNWQDFMSLGELDQARFLLGVACDAWEKQQGSEGVWTQVKSYLELGYKVLEGDLEQLPQLIIFLDDPEMKADFGAFYEQLKHDECASACLDLASYACGFVCRIAAEKSGYGPLPDPVREALPEIYEYYESRAALLNV